MPKYYKDKLYNYEQRLKVTNLQQSLTDKAIEREIKRLKSLYPNKSFDFYQEMLDRKKILSKFDERINEVL